MAAKSNGKRTKPKIAWGKILAFFLVAAWMFVIGVMVGRGTAPVHFDIHALQKELDELRHAMVKKERDAVAKAIRGEDRKASLEFYEKLKKDGTDTAVGIPSAGETVSGSIAPSQIRGVLSIPHKKRAPILGKNGKKPPEKGAKPPSPNSKPASTSGNLTIQVASLKDRTEAGRLVANLKKEGYPAYLSEVALPKKGLWFRVRVGSYADKKQAAVDMDRLSKAQKKPILLEK